MGLDHYLYEVPSKFEGRPYRTDEEIEKEVPPEERKFRKDWDDPFPREGGFYHVSGLREMCQWRKFNALHAWFVREVQGGEDECNPYIAPREKVEELLEILRKIQADPSRAPDLLPTQAGFFFGPVEYGEWYFEDVKETIPMLEMALKEQRPGTDLVYVSSW